jgi:hypothetical protein
MLENVVLVNASMHCNAAPLMIERNRLHRKITNTNMQETLILQYIETTK